MWAYRLEIFLNRVTMDLQTMVDFNRTRTSLFWWKSYWWILFRIAICSTRRAPALSDSLSDSAEVCLPDRSWSEETQLCLRVLFINYIHTHCSRWRWNPVWLEVKRQSWNSNGDAKKLFFVLFVVCLGGGGGLCNLQNAEMTTVPVLY